ncbi:MAG: M1 family metallopeptidase, partial [Patescibacteria group bacterium]
MKKALRLPVHVKPERYKIMLKPDLNEFTFTGEEIIYLSLDKPTKQITLHSVDLEIESAEASKISYDKKTETVTLTFPKTLPKGKREIKLIFKGILNDKMRGFYRSKYSKDGNEKYLATTQFESTDARRAFPCFDEPHQKAIFDVTLMIPKGHTAISNTIESDIKEHESGYQIIEFAPTPKMSTYLLAFIVGEFEYIEGESGKGKTVRVFTMPGKKEQAKFALDVAIKCLDFYEDYFGIDYPLPVLDLVAIPDFAAGAMENWGAVTFRESTLLFDETISSSANKQWVALVIAHELAHMWFGNLVTMKWWNDLWLNEGFACYIEFLAIDEIYPEFDVWTQFVSTEMADAFALDSLKNTHPIEVNVQDPAEISEIFDDVSYSKGASIIRMLAQYLGYNDFQRGLQRYLKKHAYGNAETFDLWQVLEEVSGKPVAKIMANWTGKAGHPVIRVKRKGESGKLELTQNRFFSSPISKKESKDNTVWSIPIRIKNQELRIMDKKTITIPKTEEKLNEGEVSLVRVDYPKNYLMGFKKLSAPDRLGLIRDSFDLAESGNSPTTLALELALNYKEENDYTVWSELTGKISKLDSLLAYESVYEQFRNYGRKIYGRIAKKMGW